MRGSSVLIRALVVLGVILGAPCLAPNGPAMEVVFPPARHVFRHADEVQFALLFDVASPEVLFDVSLYGLTLILPCAAMGASPPSSGSLRLL